MPYTPPSARSPAASYHPNPLDTPRRPQLPRSNSSTSYLSRHRRSPSLPEYQPDHVKPSANGHTGNTSSLRQSPPPVTEGAMPVGAIISPPDSAQNSSDEDASPREGQDEDSLRELQDAVRRSFPTNQAKSRSQDSTQSDRHSRLHLDLPVRDSEVSTPTEEQPNPVSDDAPQRLSNEARRISHARSATESSFFDPQQLASEGASTGGSDESDDDVANGKPPLLRKKSGELVKPAIRPSSRRKHSSMPGTPSYSKAVHFNDDIEQVRHFLQVDRPIAVSAGGSPAEGYEDETEFPFGFQSSQGVEWQLTLKNFPRDSFERMSKPARVEKLYLSADQKSLVGVVLVANLAYHKQVTARFTLDHWRTTSEVTAEFNNDPRSKPRDDGYDQFKFSIKLSDQANLESRTLLLCVRYNAGGQEHWDNNDGTNYQVDFVKREKPVEQRKTSPGAGPNNNHIPRSRHNSSSSKGRPRSLQSFEDDFSSGFDGESSIKFRNSAPRRGVPSASQVKAQGGPQFSTRYDFGASLSAALTQAQAQLGDAHNTRKAQRANQTSDATDMPKSSLPARTGVTAPTNSQSQTPKPQNLLANKQTMDSRAYQEFVSKFCFVGAKPVAATNTASTAPATTAQSH